MTALSTSEGMAALARAAGLNAEVDEAVVTFPELAAEDLVAWRLGMAQVAPFVAGLTTATRRAVTDRALRALGQPPVLQRRVVMLRAVV